MFVIHEGYSSVMHHVCEQSVSTKYFTRGEKSYIAHMCTFLFYISISWSCKNWFWPEVRGGQLCGAWI